MPVGVGQSSGNRKSKKKNKVLIKDYFFKEFIFFWNY
jgi:hypothetical protein